jgi:hypothetical protein
MTGQHLQHPRAFDIAAAQDNAGAFRDLMNIVEVLAEFDSLMLTPRFRLRLRSRREC